MYNYSPPVSNFTPFRSTTSRFQVTCHFETNALNDPKMTLNTTKSNVPHICVTSIHESHISLHFALQPAVFQLQAIVRQVHWMTPSWLWTLPSQISLYMYNYCLWVSNFTTFHSMTSRFEIQASLRQAHQMTPKWPWTVQGLMCHILVSTSLKFSLHFALWPAFFALQALWDKCTKWPQIVLEPYEVKLPYICITTPPESQSFRVDKVKSPYICATSSPKSHISLHFALRPAVFELQAIVRQVHQMTQIDLEPY